MSLLQIALLNPLVLAAYASNHTVGLFSSPASPLVGGKCVDAQSTPLRD